MKKLILVLAIASVAPAQAVTCDDVSELAHSAGIAMVRGNSEQKVINTGCRAAPDKCDVVKVVVESVFQQDRLMGGGNPLLAVDVTISLLGCRNGKPVSNKRAKPVNYNDTATGYDVKELQRALKDHKDPGAIDGILGRKTRQAIRIFEIRNGVSSDGAITPELLNRLGVKHDG